MVSFSERYGVCIKGFKAPSEKLLILAGSWWDNHRSNAFTSGTERCVFASFIPVELKLQWMWKNIHTCTYHVIVHTYNKQCTSGKNKQETKTFSHTRSYSPARCRFRTPFCHPSHWWPLLGPPRWGNEAVSSRAVFLTCHHLYISLRFSCELEHSFTPSSLLWYFHQLFFGKRNPYPSLWTHFFLL